MKRVFKFKKGQVWDGDEAIIQFLEEYMLENNKNNPCGCPNHRKNWKVNIEINEVK